MPIDSSNPILTTATKAARAGGKLALELLGNPGYMRWKGPREVQVEAVLAIQKRIVEVIEAAYPGANFLLEESDEPQDDQADPLWVIDPIDGSMNFNRSMPLFAVCIAYRVAGVYEVGVVYDPCHDELFQAVLTQGAYLNGQPMMSDKHSESEDAYANALVATDLPGDIELRKAALYINRYMVPEITSLWILGSPALSMCYIAAGRLHGYFALDLKIWDVAAASVILREASGTLTDEKGGPSQFSDGGYIASNGVLHGGLLRAVKPALDVYAVKKGMGV